MRYFDWAATAISDSAILKESLEIAIKNFGNPSANHDAGKAAKALLEDARATIAAVLNVSADTLYFTSGATESNQLVLTSLIARPARGSVLISSIEHPSVAQVAQNLKAAGFTVKTIPCNKDGFITADAVKAMLESDTQLVAVMAVNNETGAIQSIKEIADVLRAFSRPVLLHCDCVQALGKVPIDLSMVDSASFSAHKICAARGMGLLYLKKPLQMFLTGGGQERNIRSGTENLFGALTLARCIKKYVSQDLRVAASNNAAPNSSETIINLNGEKPLEDAVAIKSTITEEVGANNARSLMARLIDGLMDLGCTIIPRARVGNPNDYSPYILQFSNNKFPGEVLVRALNEKGFAISSGSACSANHAKNKHYVLNAMGITGDVAFNAVRVSIGYSTTASDVDSFIEAMRDIMGTSGVV